jgi:hypothetical protein
MSAKEMFELKGFKIKSNTKQYLTYEYKYILVNTRTKVEKHIRETIVFDKYEKRVGGSATGFPKKYWFDYEMIPIINKQIEELGWNKC